ncbi:uncharacterized protein METZ01_LOCUS297766 [marine metagenome]|uniref:Uncharacterized protein n=1 Tax=marine metagenome TaxID=408172 RepID=A0A382MBV0_9ZZZZ
MEKSVDGTRTEVEAGYHLNDHHDNDHDDSKGHATAVVVTPTQIFAQGVDVHLSINGKEAVAKKK